MALLVQNAVVSQLSVLSVPLSGLLGVPLVSPQQQLLGLQEIAGYALAWGGLFLLVRHAAFSKQTADFANRVVSLLHAFVAAYLAYLSFENIGLGGLSTQKQKLCMLVSQGYFVYDMVCSFLIGEDIAFVFHHLATIIGFTHGLVTGTSGTELTICLFVMEMSNPSLHLRALLRELKLKASELAFVNEVIFFLTFTVFRMLIGPLMLYYTWSSASSHLVIKVGASAVMAVNCFWYVKVVQALLRKLAPTKADPDRQARAQGSKAGGAAAAPVNKSKKAE